MESTPMPVNSDNNKSKKQFFLLLGIVLLLIIGVILMIALGGNSKNKATSQTSMNTDPGYHQTNAQLRDYKTEATIQITANGPLPSTLNVKKDTKVIWQNIDNKAHEIAIVSTEKVPPFFFNNRSIAAGGGYPWVVHQAVTFHYYIVDSPTQTGVVVVK